MRHAAAPILLALALAACSTPAAEEPAPCTGDACGGGQGGAGGAGDDCPDLAAGSPCGFDGPDDACRDDVCALAQTTCPNGARCCTLPMACLPPRGARPGGVSCSDDDECASGLCVEVSGVRSCQRSCQRTAVADSCPTGQHCETLALPGGAVASTCVGGPSLDARDPQATVCLRPSHCGEGRDCRIVNPDAMTDGRAFALCLPAAPVNDLFEPCAPPPGTTPPPEHGWEQSAACPMGGLCWDGCRGTDSFACYCSQAQVDDGTCRGYRCTGVCGTNADCPDRTQCQSFSNRSVDFDDPRQTFSICRFPFGNPLDTGCWDELDCCKGGLRSNGTQCCEAVEGICVSPLDPPEATHCRVFPGGGRYMTQCALPEGRLALGAACTDDAACVSGLCVDDGAGGRVCSSPCDVRFDRCADVLPGTACCPTVVTAEDGQHCVPSCRTGCESPAACEPP